MSKMKLNLNVVFGPDQGKSFELPAGQSMLVGRGEQATIRLTDQATSRVHFEITNQGDQLMIADKGSSYGTFVNGARIESLIASVGTEITVGDTRLKILGDDQTLLGGAGEINDVKPLAQMVGEQLGNFKLVEAIGVGSSGVVFKGVDDSSGTTAAVKVLSPTFTSSEDQRQRFVRAMKTMMPIRSSRIVRLLNAGKTGPYCWVAMEHIDGDNLADLIQKIGIEGMLDWKEVWRVAVDIAQALSVAHENKIVHRNVTPKNILRRGSDKVCFLGDLMLAKALQGTLAREVTQQGQILGELPYLAPERTGSSSELDIRSDLYGLGATCYALLTGKPPATGASMAEIINSIRNDKPEPPKKVQLSTNELFQDLIMALIEKEPADRIQTPVELLKELLRIGKFNNLDSGL
jgi:serine/threonine protein kinase